MPVKSASIRAASARPTLPNVPRQPRGEVNSPCVEMSAGAVFPGVIVVVPSVVIPSHGCCERTEALKDCRFDCGTASNVHSIVPLLGAGAFGSPGLTCRTRVPRHVPVRNDAEDDGAVGFDGLPPQAINGRRGIDASQALNFMRPRFPRTFQSDTQQRFDFKLIRGAVIA